MPCQDGFTLYFSGKIFNSGRGKLKQSFYQHWRLKINNCNKNIKELNNIKGFEERVESFLLPSS